MPHLLFELVQQAVYQGKVSKMVCANLHFQVVLCVGQGHCSYSSIEYQHVNVFL